MAFYAGPADGQTALNSERCLTYMPSRLQHDAYRGSDPLIGLHDWERWAARPRAALEEHDKSPLVDYPRLPAFTIKARASAIDSHLVRAPIDSRPFWRQPTPLDTAEHRNMRRCRRCDRADWLEPGTP